jgi:putative oxidoreductase
MQTQTSSLRYDRGIARADASASAADWLSLVGRLGLAALFLWSGYGKLAFMDGNVAYMKSVGLPAAALLIWAALLVELVGGALLATGWKARWAAAVLTVFTIVATFLFHAYWNVPADQALNQQIHFMKNVAIIGGLLGVVSHGAGRYALARE